MRALTIFLLLSLAPVVYANEQIAKTIKATNIQGVNVLMGLEQAKSILREKDYDVVSFNLEAGQAFFKKGNCIISFIHAGPGRTMMYRCLNQSRDVDILQALNALCKIKTNDSYSREGCDARNTALGQHTSESFTHSEAYKGYIYSAKIQLSEKGGGQISVAAVETKESPQVKNSKDIHVKKVTGQVASLTKTHKPIRQTVDDYVFFSARLFSASEGDAAKCRGVYYLDQTIKSFLGGEPYDGERSKQLEKYVRNIAYDYPQGTWVELSDIRIVEEGGRIMCLFREIRAIPAPKK